MRCKSQNAANKQEGSQRQSVIGAVMLPAFFLLVMSMVGLTSNRAYAGGFELMPGMSARDAGRGGAALLRADDASVLFNNPANLALLDEFDVSLSMHLLLARQCFDRSGTFTNYATDTHHDADANNVYSAAGKDARVVVGGNTLEAKNVLDSAYGRVGSGDLVDGLEIPEVCSSAIPNVIPEFAIAYKLASDFGIALGLHAPVGVGRAEFGSGDIRGGREYLGIERGLPAGSRYTMTSKNLLIAYPQIGFGWAPFDFLRVGGAFGAGIMSAELNSVARVIRGEDFATDVYSEVRVSDYFVPRVTISAQADFQKWNVPIDVGVSFIWEDDIDARGDVTLHSGYYRDEMLETKKIGANASIARPWQVRGGIRYRHSRRSDGKIESADDELFDIELDMTYMRSSKLDSLGLRLDQNPNETDGLFRIRALPDDFLIGLDTSLPIPNDISRPLRFKDQIVLRVGGDWNAVPEMLSLRVGGSYESHGVEEGYEQVMFMPFERFGVYGGATLRVGDFDFSIAYGLVHQMTRTVSESSANQVQTNADSILKDSLPGWTELFGQGTVVNAGTYRANYHLLSLGVSYSIN